jgi:hypothetical protein
MPEYEIKLRYDDAADLWVGTVDDPPVTAEAPSLGALREKIMAMIADVLECEVSAVTVETFAGAEKTSPFNVLDYLKTPEMIAAHLAVTQESGNSEYIALAMETAQRARKMFRVKQ